MLQELSVVEQRYLAVREVLDGARVSDVATRYGVDRRTVHRWLVRYANEGLGALADRSSRPDRCPHQTAPEIEARIVALRRAHPGWGPRTILSKLRREPGEPPSRSSIYRCLVRHRLISPKPRRRRPTDYRRWERSRPMELWQMDVMGGVMLEDGTEAKVITGIDDHSSFCVIAKAVARATASEPGAPGRGSRPGGRGIDPKGDLVEAILERLPRGSEDHTCIVDPDDGKDAVGLNVLAGSDPDLVVDHVAGVFKRIYEPWWGPRTDDIMRAACLTLAQIPGATLAEVPLLLTDIEWRLAIRERLGEFGGLTAFWRWYERLPEQQRAQHIAPLLNKLRAFLLRGPVRAIVGQATPKRDVESLIDDGGLLLVRVPKGTLGEDTSRLLGAFVVARVWQRCMQRASLDDERPDATLYVDETHNYLALPRSFEDLLAEARGYRLSLVLAHQRMGQLTKDVRDALAANARTKVVFTCSPEDAFILERHFAPDLSAYDLSHLATFQSACRPCVRGGQGQAFTFRTEALANGSKARAETVRRRSAGLFAVPRSEVEVVIDSRQMGAVTVLLPPEPRKRSRERSVERSRERSPERSSPLGSTSHETAGETR